MIDNHACILIMLNFDFKRHGLNLIMVVLYLLGVYAISNHPIVQVLVVGYIVKVDKKLKLTNYGGILSLCFYCSCTSRKTNKI